MENKYYVAIGLEIHCELKTATKMFCACKNPAGMPAASNGTGDPEIAPNTLICPVCTAHPGALPVVNKKAIEHVVKVGLAIGGTIADFTEFDRKNYFYPDIPKGYQISQYKYPIISGGHLAGFDITRVHLEEDTGTNKHFDPPEDGLRSSPKTVFGESYSLVDFNRAGVPLLELVTEPHVFSSDREAASGAAHFAKEFQLVLWYLDVSDANMEKGEMRVEANISISPDRDKLGTKVEVKNLNSFRSVERAIKYEIDRMIELTESGKAPEIVQETRGWDESKQKTFSQRKKESSHDYRYFPDPDLPKFKLHKAFDLEKITKELPELPEQKRARYKDDFGIKDEDIEVYVGDVALGSYFEKVAVILGDKEKIKTASNYITSDYLGLQKSNLETKFPSAGNFAELVDLVVSGKVSSRGAKDILAMIVVTDESPLKIATEQNLLQQSDEGALKTIVEKIIAENPEVVATYKGGKENTIMSLVGKVIKESGGSANPQVVIKLLKGLLK